jgi:hypothetical protein
MLGVADFCRKISEQSFSPGLDIWSEGLTAEATQPEAALSERQMASNSLYKHSAILK